MNTRAKVREIVAERLAIIESAGEERIVAEVVGAEAVLRVTSIVGTASITADSLGIGIELTRTDNLALNVYADDELTRISVRDPDGRTRATITARSTGGTVVLHDVDGHVQLAASGDPPEVAIRTKAGDLVAGLSADQT